MKKTAFIVLFVYLLLPSRAQQVFTYEYAVKDTHHLKMDLYVPARQDDRHACVIFVHGGGFMAGTRHDKPVRQFCRRLNEEGIAAIAVSYRLGLRGNDDFRPIANLKAFRKAIDMAAEDLLSAVDYTLGHLLHGDGYTIDPGKIVICGSSAGAVTVLEADYYLCNRIGGAQRLPADFRFGGVMSFAGGIFSDKGKVKYRRQPPAPTLFCHGTEDRLVPYRQIAAFNLGMYGSRPLAKRFKKYGYPYYIRRYEGIGHMVANRYNTDIGLVLRFIKQFVYEGKPLQIDERYRDPTVVREAYDTYRIRDLGGTE